MYDCTPETQKDIVITLFCITVDQGEGGERGWIS